MIMGSNVGGATLKLQLLNLNLPLATLQPYYFVRLYYFAIRTVIWQKTMRIPIMVASLNRIYFH